MSNSKRAKPTGKGSLTKSEKKAVSVVGENVQLQRIRKGYEEVDLTALRPWKDNPRNNETAIDRVAELIKHHGFAGVLVATPDGTIRAGHTRFAALLKLQKDPEYRGVKGKVWVQWRAFPSEAEAVAYSLADNKASEWSEWDREKLSKLFKQQQKKDLALLEKFSGFTKREIPFNVEAAMPAKPAAGSPVLAKRTPISDPPVDFNYVIRINDVTEKDKLPMFNAVKKALEGTKYTVKIY